MLCVGRVSVSITRRRNWLRRAVYGAPPPEPPKPKRSKTLKEEQEELRKSMAALANTTVAAGMSIADFGRAMDRASNAMMEAFAAPNRLLQSIAGFHSGGVVRRQIEAVQEQEREQARVQSILDDITFVESEHVPRDAFLAIAQANSRSLTPDRPPRAQARIEHAELPYVSLVDHGANETPFRRLAPDQPRSRHHFEVGVDLAATADFAAIENRVIETAWQGHHTRTGRLERVTTLDSIPDDDSIRETIMQQMAQRMSDDIEHRILYGEPAPNTGREPQELDEFARTMRESEGDMVRYHFWDQLERENNMPIGEFRDLPPDEALAMALAFRMTKRGPGAASVEVMQLYNRRTLRVQMEIPYSDIESLDPQAGGVMDMITSVNAHDQNAKTLLGGFLTLIKKNPAAAKLIGESNGQLQELIDAAQTLLEQDIDVKPVDVEMPTIAIEDQRPKAGSRRLNLRKKSG